MCVDDLVEEAEDFSEDDNVVEERGELRIIEEDFMLDVKAGDARAGEAGVLEVYEGDCARLPFEENFSRPFASFGCLGTEIGFTGGGGVRGACGSTGAGSSHGSSQAESSALPSVLRISSALSCCVSTGLRPLMSFDDVVVSLAVSDPSVSSSAGSSQPQASDGSSSA